MKRLPLILLAALLALAAVLAIRTASFGSRQIKAEPAHPFAIDSEALARRLSAAIQYRTVSNEEPIQAGGGEFRRFHKFLAASFPRLHAQLTKETINARSLLYSWKGKDDKLKPILLAAHMDVVPVETRSEGAWSQPPFSGRIADGYIWGRGAMDDKAGVLGILEAVEGLLGEGFQPRRTIYLAFGHDEESGGANGAAKIAERLRSTGVELEYVLDEGLNIVEGVIPGIAAPAALVGIAEKGYLSLELSVQTAGGHSSIPPTDNAIAILSRALQRVEAAPFPARLAGPTRQMLEFLGPEMAWANRVALANLWLFDPLIRNELAGSPLTNALIRTTLAPTLFNAGINESVLPTRASAVVNLRILPGETTTRATEHVQKAIADPRVKITPLPVRMEPSAVADPAARSFAVIQRTIRQVAPDAIVAPALLVAGTDSRHYAGLTKNIYRFLPITLRPDDAKRYHGIDERISIQDYERCVRFYAQLIRNSNR